MKTKQLLNIVLVLTIAAHAPMVGAQSADQNKPKAPPSKTQSEEVQNQFTSPDLLSDGMIKVMIKRRAHDLSTTLSLDSNTQEQVRKILERRWVPFLKKHRTDIGPLLSRFYEASIDPDAPSIDQVKSWATDALKIYDQAMTEFDTSNEEISKVLSPTQAEKLLQETVQFRAGLGLFRGELMKWERGEFDYSQWNQNQAARDRSRRRGTQQNTAPRITTPSTPDAFGSIDELRLTSLDVWDQYVVDFVKRYRFDEPQKLTANAILADVKDRASAHIKKNTDVFAKLKGRLRTATPADRAKIVLEQQNVLKPLDELFAELKSRLDALPTNSQRTKANEGGTEVKVPKVAPKTPESDSSKN